jgi:hypothetical protein
MREGGFTMRKLLLVSALCAVAVGCGSSNGDPVGACNNLASTTCNRLGACNLLNTGVTVAQCTTATQTALGCANAKCATGTTFDGNAANTCINDVNKESCTDLGNQVTPASCTVVFCK